MLVRFFYKPVKTSEKSEDGLPLYRDVVYVTINRDPTHTVTRAATEEDKEKYGVLFERFLKGHESYEELEGYPLEMWCALTPAEVQNLKERGIRTVEHLAGLKTTAANKLPGDVMDQIKEAKRFIELAGAGTGMTEKANRLEQVNDDLKDQLKEANKQIGILKARLDETKAKEVA